MEAPPDYWPWMLLFDYNYEGHEGTKHEVYDMPDDVKVIRCVNNPWSMNINFKVDPGAMDP